MINILDKFTPFTLILLILIPACSSLPTSQQSASISVLSRNQATVYFYRSANSAGGAVGVDIKDNGIDIGTLQDGTYFVYHANPGLHSLTATTDTASTQNFQLQADAAYYIQASVGPSQHLFQPSLNVVFELQGKAAVQNLERLAYNE